VSYYESEIIKELTVGEKYTVRQLGILLYENKDVLILSKSIPQLRISDDSRKLRVIDKIEAYAHQIDKTDRRNPYLVPNSKSVTYIVE